MRRDVADGEMSDTAFYLANLALLALAAVVGAWLQKLKDERD